MTIEQIDKYCYKHYENGGDVIVECMDDEEKLQRFPSLDLLKEYIEIYQENKKEVESTIW